MNGPAREPAASGACPDCLRRSWLLAELGAQLDFFCRDRARMLELLALDDDALVQGAGGARRDELRARHLHFTPRAVRRLEWVQMLCRHDHRYPRLLTCGAGPRMLYVAGGVERLATTARAPVVAIVGSARASDYGLEMARMLARDLAASGVGVTSSLADGVCSAALAGAAEVPDGGVGVMPGGLDVSCPPRRRALFERLRRAGCVVAELPCGTPARRWGAPAGERTAVALAQVTVVVEARDSARELACARIASALGRAVAAVPGRVTSALSAGANALLADGAPLVRGAADVFELLCDGPAARQPAAPRAAQLEPAMRRTLELVGAGSDTPDRLARAGLKMSAALLTLSELELMGLLSRGDGGRYLVRESFT